MFPVLFRSALCFDDYCDERVKWQFITFMTFSSVPFLLIPGFSWRKSAKDSATTALVDLGAMRVPGRISFGLPQHHTRICRRDQGWFRCSFSLKVGWSALLKFKETPMNAEQIETFISVVESFEWLLMMQCHLLENVSVSILQTLAIVMKMHI